MNPTRDHIGLLIRVAQALTGLVVVAPIIALTAEHWGGQYYQFHFNAYGLLPLIAAIASAILLFFTSRTKHRTAEATWFTLISLEVVYWNLTEALSRFAATPETARFWYGLTAAGWVPLGALFFIYSITLIGKSHLLNNLFIQLNLLASPLLFLVLAYSTNLIIDYSSPYLMTPWGQYPPYGTYFTIFLVSLEIFFLSSFFMLLYHYRHSSQLAARRRALYSMIGLIIPLVAGTFTNGIFPILHIQVLPTAAICGAIMIGVMGYANLRYQIFSVNPATVASNILASINDVVLILDNAYRIEYANYQASSLFGYDADALVGKAFAELLSDEQFVRLKTSLSAAGATTAGNKRYDIFTASGRRVPSLISAAPVLLDGAVRSGYAVVVTDVSQLDKVEHENQVLEDTKRAMLNALEDAQDLETQLKHEKAGVEQKIIERTRQLSEEQARLHASINSLQMGFLITDDQDHLVSINAAASALIGTEATTLTAVASKLKPSFNLTAKIAQCLKTVRPVDIKEILFGDIYLRVFISPIVVEAGHAIGTVVMLQDISEEKALQQSKDEFFSIASHELRTPLTAIRGNASLIEGYFTKQLDESPDLREMVSDIHGSSVRLIQIVNDFLDASRLEQGRIEIKAADIDITTIVGAVFTELGAVAKEKGIYLHNKIAGQPLIHADPDRVKQVVYNLVGNSMKFTQEGGITIDAEAEGKVLKVHIRDTGPGIPKDKQALLFHKFRQAGGSNFTRDGTSGTGLGLYISKLLVEKMGGKANLESSVVGQGTVFYFTVPLAKTIAKKS